MIPLLRKIDLLSSSLILLRLSPVTMTPIELSSILDKLLKTEHLKPNNSVTETEGIDEIAKELSSISDFKTSGKSGSNSVHFLFSNNFGFK